MTINQCAVCKRTLTADGRSARCAVCHRVGCSCCVPNEHAACPDCRSIQRENKRPSIDKILELTLTDETAGLQLDAIMAYIDALELSVVRGGRRE